MHLVTEKICDALKSVNYDPDIAVFVCDPNTHELVYHDNPDVSFASVEAHRLPI